MIGISLDVNIGIMASLGYFCDQLGPGLVRTGPVSVVNDTDIWRNYDQTQTRSNLFTAPVPNIKYFGMCHKKTEIALMVDTFLQTES